MINNTVPNLANYDDGEPDSCPFFCCRDEDTFTQYLAWVDDNPPRWMLAWKIEREKEQSHK